ncbi:MAG: nucleoside triphosphate pyrophosphohydrolase [Candidatus Puniceispirillum sp.]
MSKASTEFERLVEIMARLRNRENGCPWDVEQTFETIAPYTIEEAYEVADAIHNGSREDIHDELGDLLLQVVFHARIAEEEGSFSVADVARGVSDKMINRHPHVFGDRENLDAPPAQAQPIDANGQKVNWEDIKAEERAQKGKIGVLDDIAVGLPPMLRALKLQKRAARVGYDWEHINDVFDKMAEETSELKAELAAETPDTDAIKDEIGDILFVAVNLARKAGVDPETALMGCNQKFERRFRYIEQQIDNNKQNINDISLDEMESYWQDAKKLENS